MNKFIQNAHRKLSTNTCDNVAYLEKLRIDVRGKRTLGGEIKRNVFGAAAVGSRLNFPVRWALGTGGDGYLNARLPGRRPITSGTSFAAAAPEKGAINRVSAALVGPAHYVNRTVLGTSAANFLRLLHDTVGFSLALTLGLVSLFSQATLSAAGALLGLMVGLCLSTPAILLGLHKAPALDCSDKGDAEETLAFFIERGLA